MSLLRRRMMMASSAKEPDVPDTPTEELDYLTIMPLHEEEVKYFINPYAYHHHVLPFYYRINKGEWVEVNLSGTSTPVFRIDLNKTKELQLKCNSVEFNPETIGIQYFSISSIGSFSLGGTPMSIIYGDDFNAYDYVPESFLVSMFANNSGLKSIVNPETFLPYTNVSDSCYVSLFEGCTSLTNSPTLPATTLTYDCYAMMFHGCSNLKHIKMLAKEAKSMSGISIGIEDCLYDWAQGVSPTGTFVVSKDATWDTTPGALGYDGVPAGWTVITDDQESGVNLISFTIKMNPFVPSMVNYPQQTYQAVEGMTWVEWCASEYNINGFTVVEIEIGKRVAHNYDRLVNDGVSTINANDIIISDGIYYYE